MFVLSPPERGVPPPPCLLCRAPCEKWKFTWVEIVDRESPPRWIPTWIPEWTPDCESPTCPGRGPGAGTLAWAYHTLCTTRGPDPGDSLTLGGSAWRLAQFGVLTSQCYGIPDPPWCRTCEGSKLASAWKQLLDALVRVGKVPGLDTALMRSPGDAISRHKARIWGRMIAQAIPLDDVLSFLIAKIERRGEVPRRLPRDDDEAPAVAAEPPAVAAEPPAEQAEPPAEQAEPPAEPLAPRPEATTAMVGINSSEAAGRRQDESPARSRPRLLVLGGPDEDVIVHGKPEKSLPDAQYRVVQALVKAKEEGRRLSKDEIPSRTKNAEGVSVEDPIAALRRLLKARPHWKDVIDMAGQSHRGYGLKDDPSDPAH